MLGAIAVFLLTLGLGQLISTWWRLRAASLVGPSRLAGYSLASLLIMGGAFLLPQTWLVSGWALLTGPLAVILLLTAGSFIAPPPHPDGLFMADHPAHGSCRPVQIPDGDHLMPGLLLTPPPSVRGSAAGHGGAVCLAPGAGDTKISFKWRLVQALLAEGLTVLTIDLPGHGDYRQRPLAYPDCLSAVPAAVRFLRQQPGVERVGLAGISLGAAMAIKSLANGTTPEPAQVEALVIFEAPLELKFNRLLFYREAWNTYYGAPVLSLLQEISFRQIMQSWYTGGYRSRHNTAELIGLLNPLASISQIKPMPMLLVYSRRDRVAPLQAGLTLQQAAPQAELLVSKQASHVTLTLIPEINRQVARWLGEKLSRPANR